MSYLFNKFLKVKDPKYDGMSVLVAVDSIASVFYTDDSTYGKCTKIRLKGDTAIYTKSTVDEITKMLDEIECAIADGSGYKEYE